MEASFAVHKIVKSAIYDSVFYFRWRYWWWGLVNRANYQGCQFDVHFIQWQTSTDILRIMTEFAHYIQNYFQNVYISSQPTIVDKIISCKSC